MYENLEWPPKAIKDISSKPNKFKIALKHFLYTHSPSFMNLTKYQKGCCV